MMASQVPLDLADDAESIDVHGEHGMWANKAETINWQGEVPISEYEINQDKNPEVITKQANQKLDYVQECAIRYLRPPTPPAPGDIVIREEASVLTPPAPPLVIRQQPERQTTPEPVVIREAPPPAPLAVGRKVITISGKKIPPPPRKVIIERMAPVPAKPPQLLIERWLPYEQQKRKVVYQAASPVLLPEPPKNVIVQWDTPEVEIEKEVKYLGVFKTNPEEYVLKYLGQMKETDELPDIVNQIKTPEGIVLAADLKLLKQTTSSRLG